MIALIIGNGTGLVNDQDAGGRLQGTRYMKNKRLHIDKNTLF